MKGTKLVARIDEAIERHHLLQHPFYRKWQAGTLSLGKLRLYASQYYWHVEAFPVYLKNLAARARGRLREVILENLAEEEDPSAPHPRLWRDFAAGVGVDEESLWLSTALPGVEALVDTYQKICREESIPSAVAALYAYEAQVPEIAATKIEGLRNFYGVASKKALAYFEVHEQADRMHREAWRSWMTEAIDDATAERNANQILATTEKALQALWRALDAVEAA
jgi:pyrroloquinoline-quinone synthase